MRRPPRPVASTGDADAGLDALRARVGRLERRNQRLVALLRVLMAVFRALKPDLSRVRIEAAHKARLLRAIGRSRGILRARRVLSIAGLSPARLSAWRRAAEGCHLDDQPSCPGSSPQRLTLDETRAIRSLVTSPGLRHVPTGRLAVLAQREGAVFASTSTWYRLVRERGWRRPRTRVHPEEPRLGIRAERPNDLWHVDTTVIRLIDARKLYLHAVLDNFSRRVLAWTIADRLDPGNALRVLVAAQRSLESGAPAPVLLADGGVENVNEDVDALVAAGVLTRVLARTEIHFSNSIIEAWWRSLKHQWLFLHHLDSLAKVRRLVGIYVEEHNARIPHSAFQGQTPDEMYFGTGADVPTRLAQEGIDARRARLEHNRSLHCGVCA